jgi:electron transfer flavoprotein-quinone oxidoreductase
LQLNAREVDRLLQVPQSQTSSLRIEPFLGLVGRVCGQPDQNALQHRQSELLLAVLHDQQISDGAHLVPEGGLKMMPPLAADGLLLVGDAAGLGVNNGFVVRGMDRAIGSGVAAAETIIEAQAADDFSTARLQSYPARLEKSFVMQDMRTYARAVDFMKNERLFEAYPALLANVLTDIYRQEAQPKKNLMPTLLKNLKASKISLLDLVKDALAGGRAL